MCVDNINRSKMSSELIVKADYKIAIFTFGGMHTTQIENNKVPFEFKNSLAKQFPHFDKYFYVDPHQCWYHKGIAGITNSIEETTEYLSNKVRNYDKVIFAGTSAGGYAATLFGSLLNIHSVLAFAPQLDLSVFSAFNEFPKLSVSYDKKYEQLKNYINDHTRYHIFFRESIRNDIWHGKNIHFSKELHNKKNVHLEFMHKPMKKLRDNGRLKQIFNDVVYSDK